MNVIKILFLLYLLKFIKNQDSEEDDRSTILFRQFEEARDRLQEQQENLGEKIETCFIDYFQNDAQIEALKVKSYCSGLFGTIMELTFRKGMKIMVDIFKDILKIETEPFKDMFENEMTYFFELFELFIDKDLDIIQSFKDVKESYFLHVELNKFENLLQIVQKSLEKFEQQYLLQKSIRNQIQSKVDGMVRERENYLTDLLMQEETKKKLR